jgi:arsenite methyltransferase
MISPNDDEEVAPVIDAAIRRHYAKIATTGGSCCEPAGCDCSNDPALSLGTGDVVAAAELRPGERVLDLGSGAGHDALRAAERVGRSGRVDGVDLTPEMVERARTAAREHDNVEFHLGDIAALPFPDATFDVVLTNCVVNLTVDKRRAFAEARRVLRPGGRLVLSDIVFAAAPDDTVRRDAALACACVGGAALLAEYLNWLREVGLAEIRLVDGYPYGVYGGGEAIAVTLVARETRITASTCC